MNIIIVRNVHGAPRHIDLATRHGRVLAVSVVAACALLFIALGAGATALITSPRTQGLHQLAKLRVALATQRGQLTDLDHNSHRDMDALALQLGQLQAQATRLNALGERLTEVGKLGDGEFDFSSDPALGGPDIAGAGADAPLPIQKGVDNLRAEFERQTTQLDALENLLRDRKIDNELLPSGMPVAHGYIASGFGARTDPIDGHASFHRGVDFDAPMGSPVMAVADGVVTFAGVRSGYGNVIEIDHGNGYMTRYAHNSALVAQVGTRVHAGDTVAKVGSTGHSTGPHCHFEVWHDGRAVNPMAYVKKTRVRHG